ncbi:MAG: hypothetical protein ACLQLO_27735 [Mycobacterium sp.]
MHPVPCAVPDGGADGLDRDLETLVLRTDVEPCRELLGRRPTGHPGVPHSGATVLIPLPISVQHGETPARTAYDYLDAFGPSILLD